MAEQSVAHQGLGFAVADVLDGLDAALDVLRGLFEFEWRSGRVEAGEDERESAEVRGIALVALREKVVAMFEQQQEAVGRIAERLQGGVDPEATAWLRRQLDTLTEPEVEG